MFKNLTIFDLAAFDWSAAELRDRLDQHALRPIGALAMETHGWLPVGDSTVHAHGPHLLLSLGISTKILPAAVVAQHVAARAKAFEQQRGFKASRKVLRDIKDTVRDELLPQAFTRTRAVGVWIDLSARRLAVDTASNAVAELAVEALRNAVDMLSATPWPSIAGAQPGPWMTRTIAVGTGAERLTPDPSTFELSANDAAAGKARYTHLDVPKSELIWAITRGMQCTRLGVIWDNRLSVQLTDGGQLRSIRRLDTAATDTTENPDSLSADLALMAGDYTQLIDDLGAAWEGNV